jgi:type II secretory pathway component PulF
MMAIEFQFREVNEANLFRNIYPYGEKSGKMVFSLNQVAEYYEQELL